MPCTRMVVVLPGLLCSGILLGAGRPVVAEETRGPRQIVLKDHLNHRWADELVSYAFTFAPGEFWSDRLHLRDEAGADVPFQLSQERWHKDGSLASAKVWFLVPELPANGTRTWELSGDRRSPKTPRFRTDLSVSARKNVVEVTTSKVGVRLLGGRATFDAPLPASAAPAPIQSLRLRSGTWVGRGWWETELPFISYDSEVLGSGPVFAEVCVHFLLDRQREYIVTCRVLAGQEVVLLEEDFNLGDPRRFVMPDYDERRRLMWEWWGGTQGRAESPNNLYFSIYDKAAFAPDTARWAGSSATVPEKGANPVAGHYEYAPDFRQDRFDIAINPHTTWGSDESTYYLAWNRKTPGDAVSIVGLQPSRWVHPDLYPHHPGFIKQHTGTNDLGIWTTQAPDLYIRAPVNMGRRLYLIAALDAKTDVAEKASTFDRTGQLLVKYGHKPLDKIKEWVLDWEEKVPFPRMFCAPGDVEGLRARMKSHGSPEPLRFLAPKDPKQATALFEELMGGNAWYALRSWKTLTLEGYGPHVGNTNHMFLGITLHWRGALFDLLLASPSLTPEQRREARALLAFLGYCAWDQDHFPGREHGYGWGTPNQGSIALTGRALLARLLVDHPMAGEWSAKGAPFSVWDIERYINEHGVAMECPGYAGTGTLPNLMSLIAHRDKLDLSPILPRLRKFIDWRTTTMPPPDPRFGQRTLLTLGDTPYGMDSPSGVASVLLRETDPDLAAEGLWAFQQSGAGGGWYIDNGFVIDNALPVKVPDLHSRNFPGFGAVLRTGTGAPTETYLCYYHGNFSVAHYHADQGQLVLYSKGAPLLLDFGSQYVPYIRQSCFHNTLSYNHAETDELRPCPGRGHADCFYTKSGIFYDHDKEPFTCLQVTADQAAEDIAASYGQVRDFAAFPDADYARGEQRICRLEETAYRYDKPQCYNTWDRDEYKVNVPPFVWSRQVLLVKDPDPMGTNYALVHDDLTGNEKLEPAFNLWSLTKEVQVQGNRAFLPGQWDVDLDVFVAAPAAPRTLVRELAHQNGSVLANRFQSLHKKPFEERQKLLRIFGTPGGNGFTVLVYPRKVGEARPEFAVLPGVPGVKVTLPDQTHWVIVSRREVTFQDPAFTFTGTVGVVKRFQDGRVRVTLPAPGRIEYGRYRLDARGAASFEGAP